MSRKTRIVILFLITSRKVEGEPIAANDLAATLLLVTTYEYRSLRGYQREDNNL